MPSLIPGAALCLPLSHLLQLPIPGLSDRVPGMKIAGLLLPPLFLLSGIVFGRYFPSASKPREFPAPIQPYHTAPSAPSSAQNSIKSAARPTQPVLADWWDFLQTLERATLADLPALWEALPLSERNPPAGPGDSAHHQMLIERWTELDPAGAQAFVKQKARDEIGLFFIVFQTWAQQDPESALAALT